MSSRLHIFKHGDFKYKKDLKICIGNNMISRAIWCRFDVKCELLSPVRQKQFVVFEKFASVYYTKLLKKSCYLLMCVKKISQRVKTNFFESVGMLSVICLRYNFALILQENAHVFSQSKAHNLSTYIIRHS